MSVNLSVDPLFFGIEEEGHQEIQIEVNGRTVGDCLNDFLTTKPDLKKNILNEDGKLAPAAYIFLNNSPVVLDPLCKGVKSGDRIRVLSPREGG